MYLVTGGVGFVGSHVTKRLLMDGKKVIVVDNFNDFYSPQLKKDRLTKFIGQEWVRKGKLFVYRFDLSDYERLTKVFKKHRITHICHLGAQAGVRFYFDRPKAFEIYKDSNFSATVNLLELAKKYRVRNFVLASTSSVYGNAKSFPFREEQETDKPLSLYTATKKSNEVTAYTYSHLFNLPVTVLRFFNVYGPWGRPDGAYYKWADLMTRGKTIDIYGQGRQQRDWTYVDDIVEGVVKVLDRPQRYEIYNIGRGRSEKLMDFLRYLEQYLGVTAHKRFVALQPGEVRRTYASTKKLQRDFGYQPKVTIKEGVGKFVDWYKLYSLKK